MKMKDKIKGFTLVELMIVIAVIALLILVLVPRIGTIKNKSREAGLRQNMLTVEGIVQSCIDDYGITAGDITALEARIVADVNAVTIDNQKIRNPVTGKYGAIDLADAGFAATGGSVVYDLTDNASLAAVDAKFTATLADTKGMIAVGAYPNGTKVNVELIPYGTDNKRITAIEKIISQ